MVCDRGQSHGFVRAWVRCAMRTKAHFFLFQKLEPPFWTAEHFDSAMNDGIVLGTQVYKSPHLWNWQLSPKWKFAYMDLVKSMASAAQGHQTWMLAWRCGSKLLREYAASMRKEHQIEARNSQFLAVL